jgi:hypothetical protein
MKAHQKNNEAQPIAGISLHFLINSMIAHMRATMSTNNIRIENNVSPLVIVHIEDDKMSSVIYDMIETVVSNARNTSIGITAERFSDLTVVSIEDRNNFNGYALSFSLISVEAEARMAGGTLLIRDVQKKVATVSLSFLNTHAAQPVIYS